MSLTGDPFRRRSVLAASGFGLSNGLLSTNGLMNGSPTAIEIPAVAALNNSVAASSR